MRNRFFPVIFVIALATFLSCEKVEQPKEPSKTLFVLMDYSASVKETRQNYVDAFKKMLSKLKPGDRLFLWKITELSEMESKPLIDVEFPVAAPAKNEFYAKQAAAEAEEKMKAKMEEIGEKVDSFLNSDEELSKKTAIMGSLQVAEKVFKNDKRDKTLLAILSDMIEDSSEYNFEREKLSEKRIAEIIANEKNKKRLPDLSGTTVYVVGANVFC